MANGKRGEISLKLQGEDYTLRPSYEAIQAIEDQTGKGLIDLSRDALNGRLTSREAQTIVCECVKAWGRASDDNSAALQKGAAHVSPARIGELMFEEKDGITGAMAAVATVLAVAATGGYTAKGEVKAETATK
jgi:hypothetical protein